MADRKKQTAKKPMTQGVGNSRRFTAPEGTFEREHDWSKLTVNGQPIPEDLWGQMPYRMTDQGAEEHRANVAKAPGRIEITRDGSNYEQVRDDDKKLAKYEDDLVMGQLLQTDDPMKALIDKHTPVGHRGMFMGERKMREAGLVRGRLTYKKVLVKDPESGAMQEVRAGNMVLCSVPQELYDANERYYAGLGKQQQEEVLEAVQEQTDRFMSKRELRDFARHHRDPRDRDGLSFGVTEDDPDLAAHEVTEALEHETASSRT